MAGLCYGITQRATGRVPKNRSTDVPEQFVDMLPKLVILERNLLFGM